jgi:hypothetical protein
VCREDEKSTQRPSLKPLDCLYVVSSPLLYFHVIQSDILEEQEEGQEGYFQDSKALI